MFITYLMLAQLQKQWPDLHKFLIDGKIFSKHIHINRISGVMASVLSSSVVDRGFEPWSGKTKDYETGICCLSA